MELIKVILTSLLSAVALFIIAKIMGHKQMAQLDFFDYITGITIGSMAVSLSIIANKSLKTRKFINGTPTIIINNGKLYRENMKKAKLDLSEFMVMCRQAGYFNINDIQTAIFEYNGNLTILPVSNKRPLTPEDMQLAPPTEEICTELIMDGRVLGENLKRMGLDENWLNKQLKSQGYHNAKEIYFGVCDQNNQLSLFAMD